MNCHLKSVLDKAHLGRGGSVYLNHQTGYIAKMLLFQICTMLKRIETVQKLISCDNKQLIRQWPSPLHRIQTSNIKTCSFFFKCICNYSYRVWKNMLSVKTKYPPLHAFHFYEHPCFVWGKKIKKMSCKALRTSLSDLGLCLTPPCRPFIPVKFTPHALHYIKNFH